MLRMKIERQKLGYSQVALAFLAGMSIGDVSRIESGRLRPYPVQVEKISNVLGVEPETLLEVVPEHTAPVQREAAIA
jgi:transcriptional regulator with XRE-family HTH domain